MHLYHLHTKENLNKTPLQASPQSTKPNTAMESATEFPAHKALWTFWMQ